MTDYTPEALEALSKALNAEITGTKRHREATIQMASDTIADMADALRTGQLIHAQPSGDEVEAVALAMANHQRGLMGFDCIQDLKLLPEKDQEFWRVRATAAITAYEAVSVWRRCGRR